MGTLAGESTLDEALVSAVGWVWPPAAGWQRWANPTDGVLSGLFQTMAKLLKEDPYGHAVTCGQGIVMCVFILKLFLSSGFTSLSLFLFVFCYYYLVVIICFI